MPHFEIDTCRTTCRPDLRRKGAPIRTLELGGRSGGAAPRPVDAIFVFTPDLDGRPAPAVGYATEPGAGITVVGWFPASAFELWRGALAGTGRRQVEYELREPGVASGYIRRFAIGDGSAASAGPARPGSARVLPL